MTIDKDIDLQTLEAVIFAREGIEIAPAALERVEESYRFLADFAKDKIIYGINTGFGPMAQYRIGDESLTALQYNIIRSHAAGAGEALEEVYVRAAMVARLLTFLQGKSGVHPELVHLLVAFINREIYPVIPRHGSVGASGDLVQLAHLALALIGEGEVTYHGTRRPASEVMDEQGLKPLTMYLREGLAVTNGTSVMTGIGLVNLLRARRLVDREVTASVWMNEIAASYDDFMAVPLNDAKRHEGQRIVARWMRERTAGSRRVLKREACLYDGCHAESIFKHEVQPYYSLRCVPQIVGPVWEELQNCERVLVEEVNSACDNPIVDIETRNVYHGGNFHGDYVSFEMDKLKIAVTKVAMLAERQLNYLFHDRINGILPPFANMGVLGLNYGLQAAQFTATSTTAECQTLSNPMYVHSIPNNNDNQDIVSMGTNAALLAAQVIENAYQVLSVLYMGMTQAVDILQISADVSPCVAGAYRTMRTFFPVLKDDVPLYPFLLQTEQYLKHED